MASSAGKMRGPKRLVIGCVRDLATVVRDRREEMRLTLVQVAEFAGTSRFFVADLEKGKPSVQFDKIMAVLGALQVKVELRVGTPRFPKTPTGYSEARTRPRTPPMPIEHTHDDRETIVCLECGIRVRNLQKHLSTAHSMRTLEYRRRWRLPDGYDIRPTSVAERAATRMKVKAALDGNGGASAPNGRNLRA